MDKNELYQSLYKAHVRVNEKTKSRKVCQQEVIKIWNDIKSSQDLPEKVNALLIEYRAKAMIQEGNLLQTWAKVIHPKQKTASKSNEELTALEFAPESSQFHEPDVDDEPRNQDIYSDQHNTSSDNKTLSSVIKPVSNQNRCYVQVQLQKEIDELNADIILNQDRYRSGLLPEDQEKEFKNKKLKKVELESTLKRKIKDA